jgi:hypothetical protein
MSEFIATEARHAVGVLVRCGCNPREKGAGMHKWVTAALSAAVLMGLGAGAAVAGEVKGPPTGGSPATNFNLAATTHANSICAFSGLNDYINGQKDRQTQTPKDGPPGAPGHGIPGTDFADGCHGGSNPDRV